MARSDDPRDLLNSLDADALRRQIEEVDAEKKALVVLLRAAVRNQTRQASPLPSDSHPSPPVNLPSGTGTT